MKNAQHFYARPIKGWDNGKKKVETLQKYTLDWLKNILIPDILIVWFWCTVKLYIEYILYKYENE